MSIDERIAAELKFLYGEETAKYVWGKLISILNKFKDAIPKFLSEEQNNESSLTHKDIVLITYADQLQVAGQAPLSTLRIFLEKYLFDIINCVHILPFYPYSSDDGFSVIDYYQVNPQFGNWDEIIKISDKFQLMFDAVINHISSESEWFRAFIRSEEPYHEYFITVNPETDLSDVVRPRDLPLLTRVQTSKGELYVWTTFSHDQIDLDYSNPDVLLEIIEVLLFYVQNGAKFIRLDAIAYLWKVIGTSCIHLPQTHAVIRIFRAVLDKIAPEVILITETNVPHTENISYFGNYLEETGRTDEAQLVYQFPLAPLILHTFHTGNADSLRSWLKNIDCKYKFFNFIASHDGIGLRPVEGLLSQEEIQSLVNLTIAHNGKVSYKSNSDGSKSVYELNITLYDALNNPQNPQNELDIKRFLASQAIMLSLAGVPGIYFHSLFGLRNCESCFEETTRNRSINREKIPYDDLENKLRNLGSNENKVFIGYRRLMVLRCQNKSFHPEGVQIVLSTPSSIFGLLRKSPDEDEMIISLINITDKSVELSIDLVELDINIPAKFLDIISGTKYKSEEHLCQIKLDPYQILWLSQQ